MNGVMGNAITLLAGVMQHVQIKMDLSGWAATSAIGIVCGTVIVVCVVDNKKADAPH